MDKFKDLSPDQQKFIHELEIKDTKTIIEWENFFLPLALFDRKGDFLRSAGCFFKTFFGLIIFFSVVFIGFYLIKGEEMTNLIIPAVAIVVSILLLTGANQYYKEYEDRDIPNPLRSFFVPFLELLKQQSAGKSMMELAIDLNSMSDLNDKKAVDKTTDRFTYLSLLVKLPDSGILNLKIGAHGIKETDHYKLTHAIIFSLTYDGNNYQLGEEEGPFEILENQEKIVLQNKYAEHSRSKVEDDPGPDYHIFRETYTAMHGAIKKK